MKASFVFSFVLFLTLSGFARSAPKCYMSVFKCSGQVVNRDGVFQNEIEIQKADYSAGCDKPYFNYYFESRMTSKTGQSEKFSIGMYDSAANNSNSGFEIFRIHNGASMVVKAIQNKSTGLYEGEVTDSIYDYFSGPITCSKLH